MLSLACKNGKNIFNRQWLNQLRVRIDYTTSKLPLKAAVKNETKKEEITNENNLDNFKLAKETIPIDIDVTKRSLATVVTSIEEKSNIEPLKTSEYEMTGKKSDQQTDIWTITPMNIPGDWMKNYLKLSKSRLTSLVVITAMAGYAMAPAPFELANFVMCSVGTGLTSGAANAINQYHEVPFDSQMSRTKNRVLVTGKVTPAHAIGFAICSATTGLSILYFGCNGLTAALGAGNLILYTSIYTPMKRFSILNTWVGSFVGSIPPLMGWAACAGTLDVGAWILAGLLYSWQFPHFNALSWNLRPDYSRAGYRMMAVTNPDLCRKTALRYTLVLTALSLTAPVFDVTNTWFALETLPLNIYFSYLAWKFYNNSDSSSSRKLFRFSLLHLPLLMVLFLLNKKHWIFKEQQKNLGSLEINEMKSVKLSDINDSGTNILKNNVSSASKALLAVAVTAESKSIEENSKVV